jgi:nucleoside-diphosphate-sugar epimerase
MIIDVKDKMKRERILITGISGFVGSHLAEFLLERGMEVYGTIRGRSKLDNIKHIPTKIGLIETDIKHVGNLNAQRDFTDVRDIVDAYWRSVQKCEFGEVYNICTGFARRIQSVLDSLLDMTDVKIVVKQDPDRMRPSDVEILMCDCSKFREQMGCGSRR